MYKSTGCKNMYVDVQYSGVQIVDGFVKFKLVLNGINTMENVYGVFQNHILILMELTHVLTKNLPNSTGSLINEIAYFFGDIWYCLQY
jgi:hypothetical protein